MQPGWPDILPKIEIFYRENRDIYTIKVLSLKSLIKSLLTLMTEILIVNIFRFIFTAENNVIHE
jgi:hypothetical protein